MSLCSKKVVALLKAKLSGLEVPPMQAVMLGQATRMLGDKLEDIPEAAITEWCRDLAAGLMAVADPSMSSEEFCAGLDAK